MSMRDVGADEENADVDPFKSLEGSELNTITFEIDQHQSSLLNVSELDYDSINWNVLDDIDDIGPSDISDAQSRTHTLGAGRWHKEYAVLNLVLGILQSREVPPGIPLPRSMYPQVRQSWQ